MAEIGKYKASQYHVILRQIMSHEYSTFNVVKHVRTILSNMTVRAAGTQGQVPWQAIAESPETFLSMDDVWPSGIAFIEPSKLKYEDARRVLLLWASKEPGFMVWKAIRPRNGRVITTDLYPEDENALLGSRKKKTRGRTKKSGPGRSQKSKKGKGKAKALSDDAASSEVPSDSDSGSIALAARKTTPQICVASEPTAQSSAVLISTKATPASTSANESDDGYL